MDPETRADKEEAVGNPESEGLPELKRPIDQREYQRRYYVAHKAEISGRKKQRYREDDEVRATAQARALERYHQIQEQRRLSGAADQPKKQTGLKPTRVIVIDGVETVVIRAGELAKRLGIKSQTILQREKAGNFPPPTFVDEKGRRWYSEAQAELLCRAQEEQRKAGHFKLTVVRELLGLMG